MSVTGNFVTHTTMTERLPFFAWIAAAGLLTNCSRDDGSSARGAASQATPTEEVRSATTLPAAAKATAADTEKPATAEAPAPRAARRTSCNAPSLDGEEGADARSSARLAACRFEPTGTERLARFCGRPELSVPLDLDRLDSAVLELDDATRSHVRALAVRGRARGSSRRTFVLVGDSITASDYFLGPFSVGRRHELTDGVAAALTFAPRGGAAQTVIDWFREAEPGARRRKHRDSFRAPRAAKVGARAHWPLLAGGGVPSPLRGALDALDPSIAVVLLGTNDATRRVGPPEEIGSELAADLSRVVDALEERGVVPVLSTLPRHGLQSELPRCGGSPANPSNWQLTVQTNAASAAVARLACERHLPLVDLRHALDALPNHGLARDGIHPSVYGGGAGMLTEEGLSCGYNARNYLTLRMLTQLQQAME
jgi:hypothetical protein